MLQRQLLPYSERVRNISKWRRCKLDASVPFGQNHVAPRNNARIHCPGIGLLPWIPIRTRTRTDHQSRKLHKVGRINITWSSMEAPPTPKIDVAHMNRPSDLDTDTSAPQIPLVRLHLSFDGHPQLNVHYGIAVYASRGTVIRNLGIPQ